jgi:hypothetical protein
MVWKSSFKITSQRIIELKITTVKPCNIKKISSIWLIVGLTIIERILKFLEAINILGYILRICSLTIFHVFSMYLESTVLNFLDPVITFSAKGALK